MDIYEKVVLPALNESLASVPNRETIEIGPDFPLFGNKSVFDSLAFVSFIILVEERISDTYGKSISLVDDKAFASRASPFKNVQTLCDYVKLRIDSE